MGKALMLAAHYNMPLIEVSVVSMTLSGNELSLNIAILSNAKEQPSVNANNYLTETIIIMTRLIIVKN
jgi:hypothetical protein